MCGLSGPSRKKLQSCQRLCVLTWMANFHRKLSEGGTATAAFYPSLLKPEPKSWARKYFKMTRQGCSSHSSIVNGPLIRLPFPACRVAVGLPPSVHSEETGLASALEGMFGCFLFGGFPVVLDAEVSGGHRSVSPKCSPIRIGPVVN